MDCNKQLSITEVSERTGINPVTLRAWQRRYNLVQPARSKKGHRLYSAQDLKTIKEIQGWLAKGVSIGKVKTLIESTELSGSPCPENRQLEEVHLAIEYLSKLDMPKLQQLLVILFKEYPLGVIESQFVYPIIDTLGLLKSAQQQSQKHLFKTVVKQRLAWLIESERKLLRSAQSALIIVVGAPGSVFGWFRYARLQRTHKVTFLENMNDMSSLLKPQLLSRFDGIEILSGEHVNAKLVHQIKQLQALSPATVTQLSAVTSYLNQAN
ncbi:MerR family transcriptional regulator [Vibrio sp. ZSDZ34]|uniref:MerR family transcriptional regulator n=1 Tax=Vibrio gelatinilyticus TaxID=2893468 RepID=A0A9X1W9D2_9VIBR|nr:MerR family transcriptional regulator [Vibrio gelatinilyticus]MCJ2376171.1 MerR family transcriptional regulator [Vibrio gelatinilyticus]